MVSGIYSLVIVDDEDLSRVAIQRYILKMHPEYSVIQTFSNGRDAWDYMSVSGADVLFTDIRMPLMDGLELARLVYESSPNTATIIISSFGEFEYAKRAIQNRLVEYLLKPLDYRELSKCLSESHHTEALAPSISQSGEDDTPDQDTNHSVFMEQAIAYIHKHYAQPLTREILTEQLHLSPSYFSRIFKQYTGMSFLDYLRTVRMQKACELLSTRCIIKDIARKVGYQSINRFLYNFQNHFGCTPSEYRFKNYGIALRKNDES